MSFSTDQLLTWLLLYGYPMLFLTVLMGSMGVPIPVNVVVLAAGGFVAEGDMDLAIVVVVVFCAALLGDCLVYGLARWLGEDAVQRHGARVGFSPARLAAARARFAAGLGLAVFMTRWLLTPLSVPTDVVAGISRYPLAAFAGFAFVGEALWTGGYVTIGYVFGASWPGIVGTVQDSAWVVVGVGLTLVALGLLYLLFIRPARASRRSASRQAQVR